MSLRVASGTLVESGLSSPPVSFERSGLLRVEGKAVAESIRDFTWGQVKGIKYKYDNISINWLNSL